MISCKKHQQSDESASTTPISINTSYDEVSGEEEVHSDQSEGANYFLSKLKCGEIFLTQQNKLQQHHFSFRCAFCDKEWQSLKRFLRHMLQNHVTMQNTELEQEERAILKQNEACYIEGEMKEEKIECEIELLETNEELAELPIKNEPTNFLDKFEIFLNETGINKVKEEVHEYAHFEEDLEILEEEQEENESFKNIEELTNSTINFEVEFLASTHQQKLFKIPMVMDSSIIPITPTLPGKKCSKTLQNHAKIKTQTKRHTTTNSFNKLHKCEFCNLTFTESSNLKVHRNRHLGIKPHRCEFCDKGFISTSELKLHMRSHTNERPYMCSDCGQSFTNSGHLSTHRRRHSNSRPHVCLVCGKSFYDKPLLRAHEASHSNARPFVCIECHTAFSRRKALMEHMRLHSGIKKYSCKICSKAFAQNSGLHSHMRKHHGTVKLRNEIPNII